MVKNQKNKVNVKARFNRHIRIVKENIGNSDGLKNTSSNILLNNNHYKIVLFIILFILPIYPTLASVLYNNSQVDFYRGHIDESSIIESYYGGGNEEVEQIGSPILESRDSFLSVNTILDDERDLEGTNEIVDYEIKPGDSFYSISYKFKVSTNSIYWANDFTKSHVLQPGEIIKVPPVTGLIHQVKSGDTLSSIAKKYDIEESKIVEQNGLSSGYKLIAGEVLVIPGAIKIKPKPVYVAPKTKSIAKKKTGIYKSSSSQYTNNQGTYKLVWRSPYSGVWGNCTWYVASYKNVDWRGNANQWIRNAKAKGHPTGNTPKVGAIVQFTGRGYNPRYGHVGIVMDVKSDHIIVSDMNYRRLNEVTYRKVPINDRAIDGYIYVD